MTIPYEAFPYFQSAAIFPPLGSVEPKSKSESPVEPLSAKAAVQASFGDSIYQWGSETPKAPIVGGVGALGSTLWYGLSYAGVSSAPWQSIVGSLGAGMIAAPFEAYENYTLYRQGKRSLSHSILDGASDTISAGIAAYIGSTVGSLIISSAAIGAAVPLRATLGAGLAAAAIGFGVWYGLSALKNGIFKDMGIS